MENMDDETTVFSTLKSFNLFLSQKTPKQDSVLEGSTLQFVYQQRMQLEEQADKLHSKSQLLQMDQEKKQMELSHKRARIELEKAAQSSAIDFEREADRNRELISRIKKLEERENEMDQKLKEQMELNQSFRKTLGEQGKTIQEKESKLAEANETIGVLRADISELQRKLKSQEMQLIIEETERQGLQEQVEVLQKKCQEVSVKSRMLQECQSEILKNDLKIKELEKTLALQEQDSVIVKNMRSELAQLPDMEQELKKLRQENAYLRDIMDNNGLLKEEVEGMRRKLERSEKIKEEMIALELKNEKLVAKLQAWEDLEQATGLGIRTPDDFSRVILEIQQRELDLKQQNYSVTSSARALEKARQQLQTEVVQLRAKILEGQKTQENQDAQVRRLQRRIFLLTKERDGIKAILESYDSELTTAYSTQLSQRVKEAEEMLQKVQAHNSEMEAQLSKAQEEAVTYKFQAETVQAEMNLLKSQAATAETSASVTSEEANFLRQKIEELEAERSRLEEQNNVLEMRLERHNLQGDYDPTKTKVIHFKMNPSSVAKQQRVEDIQQLREECERLREHIRTAQALGTLPKDETALTLPPPQEVIALRKQIESSELMNQRLKEIFQKKIQEFRTVCYTLTGYQIDFTTENQYRLISMYAENTDDCLLFKANSPNGGNMQLLETNFSRSLTELIELHLFHQNSIPAFLSAVTLDLFSRQTFA
ncbi:mitotic spindle assembly checkpoint protein MAD1 [Erpetoichthys calabaricus]|nr:mitotic spindle assembly checkpoint protein MAD1 [Erpetoichthys calabaricus]